MCGNHKSSKSQYAKIWLSILVITLHSGYVVNDNVTIDKGLKYILIWTPWDWFPFKAWKKGQDTFKGCKHSNCFVVTRDDAPKFNLSIFDAIAFNGRNLEKTSEIKAPEVRYPHQKYIYFNQESADHFPACHPGFDSFFNFTATYALNSDIPFTYIEIRKNGLHVGPKKDMVWLDIRNQVKPKTHENKTKAVAWFVSNCRTRSHREQYAKLLQSALEKRNLSLDSFGKCSKLECPKNKGSELLNRYYFYLSFENSFSEDYVTEKLLTALNNDAVPIVFGGANYSRFVPPGTYLDARQHSPDELATIIQRLIKTPKEYDQFFSWRNYYSYHVPNNDCRLCAALNNHTLMRTHNAYHDFRRWWNPEFHKQC